MCRRLLVAVSLSQNGGEGRDSPSPRSSTLALITKLKLLTLTRPKFTSTRMTRIVFQYEILSAYVDLYVFRKGAATIFI